MTNMTANYLQRCIDPTLAWGNDSVPPGAKKLNFDVYGKARAALNHFMQMRVTPEGKALLAEWNAESRSYGKSGKDDPNKKLSIFFIDEYIRGQDAVADIRLNNDADTAAFLFGGYVMYLAVVAPDLLKEVESVRCADDGKPAREVQKALTNKCDHFIHDVIVQASYLFLQFERRKLLAAHASKDSIKKAPRSIAIEQTLAVLCETLARHIADAGIASEGDASYIAAEVCINFKRPYAHLDSLRQLCIFKAHALNLREGEQQLIVEVLGRRGTDVSVPSEDLDDQEDQEDREDQEENTQDEPVISEPVDEGSRRGKKETRFDKLRKKVEGALALYSWDQDELCGVLEEAIRKRITADILESFIRLASGQLTAEDKEDIREQQRILKRNPALADQNGIADVKWDGRWQRTLQLRYGPETIGTNDLLPFHARLAQHLLDPSVEKPTDQELAKDLGWKNNRYVDVATQLSFGLVSWGLAIELFEEEADPFLKSTVNYLIHCTFDKWTLLPIVVGSDT